MSRFCRTIIVANNPGEAELAKLANNAFRDVCFGFSNEIAQIAIQNLIDVNSSIELANQGYSRGGIPSPSPGVGGPCLSKDSWILIEAKKNEIDQISGIRHFRLQNLMMPKVVTDMIVSILKNHLNVTLGKLEVLVIGLAFKGEPETNDLRNSSSLEICKNLSQEGLSVFVHDSVIDTRHLSEFNYEAAKVNQIFQVIVIANNHRNNLNIAGSYVSRTENSLVFDLWELSRSSEQKDLRFPSSTIVIGLSGNVISGKS
jgi:nucleotide sugar dehydrogenase